MEKVAVIGAGVSGIVAADVWQRLGFDVTVFDAADTVGGQWSDCYHGVTLQNTFEQYQFPRFPWPFQPSRHPTSNEVMRYIHLAVEHFDLRVELNTRVASMTRLDVGWELTLLAGARERAERFAFVLVATGQYPPGAKALPRVPARDSRVKVLARAAPTDLRGARVVVAGNGKTALDMAILSAQEARETTHVARQARWAIPDRLLGVCYTRPFFCRASAAMMPWWSHPTRAERALHAWPLALLVRGFWRAIALLFLFQYWILGSSVLDSEGRKALLPRTAQFERDLRSASAVLPDAYFAQVAAGRLRARQGEVAEIAGDAVRLADGREIECDVLIACYGNEAPEYPFLPPDARAALRARGGAQLYRHLAHPALPDTGFAGMNHGFLHLALCEVGALWLAATHLGVVKMPVEEEMRREMQEVAAWKAENMSFEATGNCAVNTRFIQHLDLLCMDLGLQPYRKLPNVAAELVMRYDPTDYATIVDEFKKKYKI